MVLIPLYDIFIKNQDIVNDNQMIERFRSTLGKSDLLIYVNMGNNREVVNKIRGILLGYMNVGYSQNRFQ